MKKILLKVTKIVMLMMLVPMFLVACIYQNHFRPQRNNDEVWVCNNPRAEIYFTEEERYGHICVGEKNYDIVFFGSSGPDVTICSANVREAYKEYIEDGVTREYIDGSIVKKHTILRCDADYKKDAFDLKVEEDVVNMFGGEKPTLHFEKRNKEEYLKEIGEEP